MLINVFLNDKHITINANTTLSRAIEQWQLTTNTFAIALNQNFIPKDCYHKTLLNENDRIEIVTAMQGG